MITLINWLHIILWSVGILVVCFILLIIIALLAINYERKYNISSDDPNYGDRA